MGTPQLSKQGSQKHTGLKTKSGRESISGKSNTSSGFNKSPLQSSGYKLTSNRSEREQKSTPAKKHAFPKQLKATTISKGQKKNERPIMYTPGQQPTVEGMVEWLQSQGVDLPSSSKVTGDSDNAPSTDDTGEETIQKPRKSSKKKSSKKSKNGGDKDEL